MKDDCISYMGSERLRSLLVDITTSDRYPSNDTKGQKSICLYILVFFIYKKHVLKLSAELSSLAKCRLERRVMYVGWHQAAVIWIQPLSPLMLAVDC